MVAKRDEAAAPLRLVSVSILRPREADDMARPKEGVGSFRKVSVPFSGVHHCIMERPKKAVDMLQPMVAGEEVTEAGQGGEDFLPKKAVAVHLFTVPRDGRGAKQ